MKKIGSILVLLISFSLFAQNTVRLDSTFGVNGKVTTLIQPEGFHISTSSILKNNGEIMTFSSFTGFPILTKFTHNGHLDSSFGVNGFIETRVDSGNYCHPHWGHLNDNNYYFPYYKQNGYSTPYYKAIRKYDINGNIVNGFGILGKVEIFEGYYNQSVQDFRTLNETIISDSNIYIVGKQAVAPLIENLCVVAYNKNTGKIDSTFGNFGAKIFNINVDFQTYMNIEQFDDEFYITTKDELIKFNQNFEIDSSFGTNGVTNLQCAFGFGISYLNSKRGMIRYLFLDKQNDGKLIVVGLTNDEVSCSQYFGDGIIERYNIDGSLDTSFGNNGISTFNLRQDTINEINMLFGLKVLNGNKILIAGSFSDTLRLKGKIAMTLFDENGNVVSSFGTNGLYVESNFYNTDTVDVLDNLNVYNDSIILLSGISIFSDYEYDSVRQTYYPSPFQSGLNSIIHGRYIISNIPPSEPAQTNDTIIIIDTVYITDTTYVLDTIYNPSDTVVVNDTTVIYDTITVYDTINTNIINVEKGSFSIYPNPALNNLFVKSEIPLEQYVIYDYLGKAVLQNKLKEKPIDISRLSNGVYIISFITENGNFYHARFVKE